MSGKKALITGIAGQDGAYLAQLLLEKGYKVYGTVKSAAKEKLWRLRELGIESSVQLAMTDFGDQESVNSTLKTIQPSEIYNLAAQSSVVVSWESPLETVDANGLGVVRLLEGIRHHAPQAKYFQAGSSELFGENRAQSLQNEKTPFHPRSPYALGKLLAHTATVMYRESFGIFACTGILFSHDSPLRDLKFVTRKITDGVARIKLGLADSLTLGNIDAKRDWGFAGDFTRAMWLMMQHEKADDYVIATGESHSVREFVTAAFEVAGIRDGEKYLRIDDQYRRAVELGNLTGDISKARTVLHWKPSVDFHGLISMMVESDLKRLSSQKL